MSATLFLALALSPLWRGATARTQEASCPALSLPGQAIKWQQSELRARADNSRADHQRGISFKFDLLGSMQASYAAGALRSLYKLESAQGALVAFGYYGREGANEFVQVFDCSSRLLGTWREILVGDSLRWQVEVVLEDPASRVIAKTETFRHLAGRFWVMDMTTGAPWLTTDQIFSSAPELNFSSPSSFDSRLAPFVLLFRSTPKNNHL